MAFKFTLDELDEIEENIKADKYNQEMNDRNAAARPVSAATVNGKEVQTVGMSEKDKFDQMMFDDIAAVDPIRNGAVSMNGTINKAIANTFGKDAVPESKGERKTISKTGNTKKPSEPGFTSEGFDFSEILLGNTGKLREQNAFESYGAGARINANNQAIGAAAVKVADKRASEGARNALSVGYLDSFSGTDDSWDNYSKTLTDFDSDSNNYDVYGTHYNYRHGIYKDEYVDRETQNLSTQLAAVQEEIKKYNNMAYGAFDKGQNDPSLNLLKQQEQEIQSHINDLKEHSESNIAKSQGLQTTRVLRNYADSTDEYIKAQKKAYDANVSYFEFLADNKASENQDKIAELAKESRDATTAFTNVRNDYNKKYNYTALMVDSYASYDDVLEAINDAEQELDALTQVDVGGKPGYMSDDFILLQNRIKDLEANKYKFASDEQLAELDKIASDEYDAHKDDGTGVMFSMLLSGNPDDAYEYWKVFGQEEKYKQKVTSDYQLIGEEIANRRGMNFVSEQATLERQMIEAGAKETTTHKAYNDLLKAMTGEYFTDENGKYVSYAFDEAGNYTGVRSTQIAAFQKAMKADGYSDDEIRDIQAYLQRQVNAAQMNDLKDIFTSEVNQGFGSMVVLTLGSSIFNLGSGLGMIEGVKSLFDKSHYRTIDTNSEWMVFNAITDTIRSASQEKYDYNMTIGGKQIDVFDKVYGMTTSTIDSVLASKLGGALAEPIADLLKLNEMGALINIGALPENDIKHKIAEKIYGYAAGSLLGAAAATQTLVDMTEKGATAAQAFSGAIVAGITESFFESFSIENLNMMAEHGRINDIRGVVTDFLKSFAVNTSEELNTEAANVLYDIIHNGYLSDFQRLKDQYYNDYVTILADPTMAPEEIDRAARQYAYLQASQDTKDRVIEAGIDGGLQSILMSGSGLIARSVSSATRVAELNKLAKQDITKLDLEELRSYSVDVNRHYEGLRETLQADLKAGSLTPRQAAAFLSAQEMIASVKVEVGNRIAKAMVDYRKQNPNATTGYREGLNISYVDNRGFFNNDSKFTGTLLKGVVEGNGLSWDNSGKMVFGIWKDGVLDSGIEFEPDGSYRLFAMKEGKLERSNRTRMDANGEIDMSGIKIDAEHFGKIADAIIDGKVNAGVLYQLLSEETKKVKAEEKAESALPTPGKETESATPVTDQVRAERLIVTIRDEINNWLRMGAEDPGAASVEFTIDEYINQVAEQDPALLDEIQPLIDKFNEARKNPPAKAEAAQSAVESGELPIAEPAEEKKAEGNLPADGEVLSEAVRKSRDYQLLSYYPSEAERYNKLAAEHGADYARTVANPDAMNSVQRIINGLDTANISDEVLTAINTLLTDNGLEAIQRAAQEPAVEAPILQAEAPTVKAETPKPKAAAAQAVDSDIQNAVDVIRKAGKATVATLQEGLGVSRGKAVQIMKKLEAANLVGPYTNGKARTINFELENASTPAEQEKPTEARKTASETKAEVKADTSRMDGLVEQFSKVEVANLSAALEKALLDGNITLDEAVAVSIRLMPGSERYSERTKAYFESVLNRGERKAAFQAEQKVAEEKAREEANKPDPAYAKKMQDELEQKIDENAERLSKAADLSQSERENLIAEQSRLISLLHKLNDMISAGDIANEDIKNIEEEYKHGNRDGENAANGTRRENDTRPELSELAERRDGGGASEDESIRGAELSRSDGRWGNLGDKKNVLEQRRADGAPSDSAEGAGLSEREVKQYNEEHRVDEQGQLKSLLIQEAAKDTGLTENDFIEPSDLQTVAAAQTGKPVVMGNGFASVVGKEDAKAAKKAGLAVKKAIRVTQVVMDKINTLRNDGIPVVILTDEAAAATGLGTCTISYKKTEGEKRTGLEGKYVGLVGIVFTESDLKDPRFASKVDHETVHFVIGTSDRFASWALQNIDDIFNPFGVFAHSIPVEVSPGTYQYIDTTGQLIKYCADHLGIGLATATDFGSLKLSERVAIFGEALAIAEESIAKGNQSVKNAFLDYDSIMDEYTAAYDDIQNALYKHRQNRSEGTAVQRQVEAAGEANAKSMISDLLGMLSSTDNVVKKEKRKATKKEKAVEQEKYTKTVQASYDNVLRQYQLFLNGTINAQTFNRIAKQSGWMLGPDGSIVPDVALYRFIEKGNHPFSARYRENLKTLAAASFDGQTVNRQEIAFFEQLTKQEYAMRDTVAMMRMGALSKYAEMEMPKWYVQTNNVEKYRDPWSKEMPKTVADLRRNESFNVLYDFFKVDENGQSFYTKMRGALGDNLLHCAYQDALRHIHNALSAWDDLMVWEPGASAPRAISLRDSGITKIDINAVILAELYRYINGEDAKVTAAMINDTGDITPGAKLRAQYNNQAVNMEDLHDMVMQIYNDGEEDSEHITFVLDENGDPVLDENGEQQIDWQNPELWDMLNRRSNGIFNGEDSDTPATPINLVEIYDEDSSEAEGRARGTPIAPSRPTEDAAMKAAFGKAWSEIAYGRNLDYGDVHGADAGFTEVEGGDTLNVRNVNPITMRYDRLAGKLTHEVISLEDVQNWFADPMMHSIGKFDTLFWTGETLGRKYRTAKVSVNDMNVDAKARLIWALIDTMRSQAAQTIDISGSNPAMIAYTMLQDDINANREYDFEDDFGSQELITSASARNLGPYEALRDLENASDAHRMYSSDLFLQTMDEGTATFENGKKIDPEIFRELGAEDVDAASQAYENYRKAVHAFDSYGADPVESGKTIHFATFLNGVSFDNRQELIAKINNGDKLTLEREVVRDPETDQIIDENAVAVKNSDGETIGYIPRRDKRRASILDALNHGDPIEVKAVGKRGGNDYGYLYGISADVTINPAPPENVNPNYDFKEKQRLYQAKLEAANAFGRALGRKHYYFLTQTDLDILTGNTPVNAAEIDKNGAPYDESSYETLSSAIAHHTSNIENRREKSDKLQKELIALRNELNDLSNMIGNGATWLRDVRAEVQKDYNRIDLELIRNENAIRANMVRVDVLRRGIDTATRAMIEVDNKMLDKAKGKLNKDSVVSKYAKTREIQDSNGVIYFWTPKNPTYNSRFDTRKVSGGSIISTGEYPHDLYATDPFMLNLGNKEFEADDYIITLYNQVKAQMVSSYRPNNRKYIGRIIDSVDSYGNLVTAKEYGAVDTEVLTNNIWREVERRLKMYIDIANYRTYGQGAFVTQNGVELEPSLIKPEDIWRELKFNRQRKQETDPSAVGIFEGYNKVYVLGETVTTPSPITLEKNRKTGMMPVLNEGEELTLVEGATKDSKTLLINSKGEIVASLDDIKGFVPWMKNIATENGMEYHIYAKVRTAQQEGQTANYVDVCIDTMTTWDRNSAEGKKFSEENKDALAKITTADAHDLTLLVYETGFLDRLSDENHDVEELLWWRQRYKSTFPIASMTWWNKYKTSIDEQYRWEHLDKRQSASDEGFGQMLIDLGIIQSPTGVSIAQLNKARRQIRQQWDSVLSFSRNIWSYDSYGNATTNITNILAANEDSEYGGIYKMIPGLDQFDVVIGTPNNIAFSNNFEIKAYKAKNGEFAGQQIRQIILDKNLTPQDRINELLTAVSVLGAFQLDDGTFDIPFDPLRSIRKHLQDATEKQTKDGTEESGDVKLEKTLKSFYEHLKNSKTKRGQDLYKLLTADRVFNNLFKAIDSGRDMTIYMIGLNNDDFYHLARYEIDVADEQTGASTKKYLFGETVNEYNGNARRVSALETLRNEALDALTPGMKKSKSMTEAQYRIAKACQTYAENGFKVAGTPEGAAKQIIRNLVDTLLSDRVVDTIDPYGATLNQVLDAIDGLMNSNMLSRDVFDKLMNGEHIDNLSVWTTDYGTEYVKAYARWKQDVKRLGAEKAGPPPSMETPGAQYRQELKEWMAGGMVGQKPSPRRQVRLYGTADDQLVQAFMLTISPQFSGFLKEDSADLVAAYIKNGDYKALANRIRDSFKDYESYRQAYYQEQKIPYNVNEKFSKNYNAYDAYCDAYYMYGVKNPFEFAGRRIERARAALSDVLEREVGTEELLNALREKCGDEQSDKLFSKTGEIEKVKADAAKAEKARNYMDRLQEFSNSLWDKIQSDTYKLMGAKNQPGADYGAFIFEEFDAMLSVIKYLQKNEQYTEWDAYDLMRFAFNDEMMAIRKATLEAAKQFLKENGDFSMLGIKLSELIDHMEKDVKDTEAKRKEYLDKKPPKTTTRKRQRSGTSEGNTWLIRDPIEFADAMVKGSNLFQKNHVLGSAHERWMAYAMRYNDSVMDFNRKHGITSYDEKLDVARGIIRSDVDTYEEAKLIYENRAEIIAERNKRQAGEGIVREDVMRRYEDYKDQQQKLFEDTAAWLDDPEQLAERYNDILYNAELLEKHIHSTYLNFLEAYEAQRGTKKFDEDLFKYMQKLKDLPRNELINIFRESDRAADIPALNDAVTMAASKLKYLQPIMKDIQTYDYLMDRERLTINIYDDMMSNAPDDLFSYCHSNVWHYNNLRTAYYAMERYAESQLFGFRNALEFISAINAEANKLGTQLAATGITALDEDGAERNADGHIKMWDADSQQWMWYNDKPQYGVSFMDLPEGIQEAYYVYMHEAAQLRPDRYTGTVTSHYPGLREVIASAMSATPYDAIVDADENTMMLLLYAGTFLTESDLDYDTAELLFQYTNALQASPFGKIITGASQLFNDRQDVVIKQPSGNGKAWIEFQGNRVDVASLARRWITRRDPQAIEISGYSAIGLNPYVVQEPTQLMDEQDAAIQALRQGYFNTIELWEEFGKPNQIYADTVKFEEELFKRANNPKYEELAYGANITTDELPSYIIKHKVLFADSADVQEGICTALNQIIKDNEAALEKYIRPPKFLGKSDIQIKTKFKKQATMEQVQEIVNVYNLAVSFAWRCSDRTLLWNKDHRGAPGYLQIAERAKDWLCANASNWSKTDSVASQLLMNLSKNTPDFQAITLMQKINAFAFSRDEKIMNAPSADIAWKDVAIYKKAVKSGDESDFDKHMIGKAFFGKNKDALARYKDAIKEAAVRDANGRYGDLNKAVAIISQAKNLGLTYQDFVDYRNLLADTSVKGYSRKVEKQFNKMMHIAGKTLQSDYSLAKRFSSFANEWRYAAMLSQPTTHLTNITSTAANIVTMTATDSLQWLMERGAVKRGTLNKNDCTVAPVFFGTDKELLKLGSESYKLAKNMIYTNGRLQSMASAVSKESESYFGNANISGWALEKEDQGMGFALYRTAFASILKARGISAEAYEKLTTAEKANIQTIAVRKTQEALFRRMSTLSKVFSTMNNTYVGQIILRPILPFAKMAGNLMSRAIEISPIEWGAVIYHGVANCIAKAYDKNGFDADAYKNGLQKFIYEQVMSEGSASTRKTNQMHRISCALVGSIGLIAGIVGRGLGFMTGGGDDDDDLQRLKEAQGWKKYSFVVGDKYISMGRVFPAGISLMIGAKIYDLFDGADYKFGEIFKETLAENTFVSSVASFFNRVSESKSYDNSDDIDQILNTIGSYAVSYLESVATQYNFGIFKTIENLIEAEKDVFYYDKDSGVPYALQYVLSDFGESIPFVDYNRAKDRDMCGHTVPGETLNDYLLRVLIGDFSRKKEPLDYNEWLEELASKEYKDDKGNTKKYASLIIPEAFKGTSKYFFVDGARVTPEELDIYKDVISRELEPLYQELTYVDDFQSASDADKVSLLKEMVSAVEKKARAAVMDYRGKENAGKPYWGNSYTGIGNIDLNALEPILDDNGQWMANYVYTIKDGDEWVNIPGIIEKNGKLTLVNEADAIDEYKAKDKYFGKFKTEVEAEAGADALKLQQEVHYKKSASGISAMIDNPADLAAYTMLRMETAFLNNDDKQPNYDRLEPMLAKFDSYSEPVKQAMHAVPGFDNMLKAYQSELIDLEVYNKADKLYSKAKSKDPEALDDLSKYIMDLDENAIKYLTDEKGTPFGNMADTVKDHHDLTRQVQLSDAVKALFDDKATPEEIEKYDELTAAARSSGDYGIIDLVMAQTQREDLLTANSYGHSTEEFFKVRDEFLKIDKMKELKDSEKHDLFITFLHNEFPSSEDVNFYKDMFKYWTSYPVKDTVKDDFIGNGFSDAMASRASNILSDLKPNTNLGYSTVRACEKAIALNNAYESGEFNDLYWTDAEWKRFLYNYIKENSGSKNFERDYPNFASALNYCTKLAAKPNSNKK